MKKVVLPVSDEIIVKDYLELGSSYKVAKKHNTSATAVKRILKELRVLRTQTQAALDRDNSHCGRYKRTEEQKEKLSSYRKSLPKEKHPCFGKPKSDETKQKIRNSLKKKLGKDNPNFRHGKTIRRPRDFKIHEFTPIRNKVFNRDKHTCFYCKNKGGHLHAHHKIPYWVKPEAFLDEENLVTVCTTCHLIKAHKNNWASFDIDLISEELLTKYSLNRERLNEMATKYSRCNSLNSRNT